MRTQAAVLALVILISLAVTGAIRSENNGTPNPLKPSFMKDFSLSLKQKREDLAYAVKYNSELIFNKLAEFSSRNEEKTLASFNAGAFAEGDKQRDSLPLPPVADYCNPVDSSGLTGKAALVKYLNYNLPVFEKNPDKRWPMASITKLMTSVVALEEIDQEVEIKMSERAINTEGAAGDLRLGEIYKAKDLIKAMLVVSSNDAAMALSEEMGEQKLIDAMQRKANELGMLQTTYVEPTGLSFINQSTISDLEKLANYIYKKHPELLEISRQKELKILELKSKRWKNLLNVDAFAGEPDFLGGKTGYTDAAGRNLVAIFNIENQAVLTIVLGANDSFVETRKIKDFVRYCEQPKQWFWQFQKS